MAKAAATSEEFDKFSAGLRKLLRADPKLVKAAMEQEKKERAEERRAKGASSPVSTDRKP